MFGETKNDGFLNKCFYEGAGGYAGRKEGRDRCPGRYPGLGTE